MNSFKHEDPESGQRHDLIGLGLIITAITGAIAAVVSFF